MPDASGRIRPVSIPRVPWHETAIERQRQAVEDEIARNGFNATADNVRQTLADAHKDKP